MSLPLPRALLGPLFVLLPLCCLVLLCTPAANADVHVKHGGIHHVRRPVEAHENYDEARLTSRLVSKQQAEVGATKLTRDNVEKYLSFVADTRTPESEEEAEEMWGILQWFVLFESHKCMHCISLNSTWQAYAVEQAANIHIGSVECNEEPYICAAFNITSFPTMKLLMFGEAFTFPSDSKRKPAAFTKFLEGDWSTVDDSLIAPIPPISDLVVGENDVAFREAIAFYYDYYVLVEGYFTRNPWLYTACASLSAFYIILLVSLLKS
eukprot:TRINITY_DN1975_c0_g1_i1.p1 TRINITY_DN1975_c0_g1~~TRINITY_DN1975_c0_g1_i1.p1  ORF type:complete len:266 (-),score=77.79 TRINITY_DN1975_c0_g1_i1:405-1202(-)